MELNRLCYGSFGGSFLALGLACLPASAEELQNWSFNTATSELTFSLPDTILPKFFLLAEPPRLVLDIPQANIGEVEPDQTYNNGSVQTIRVAQHTDEQVRVVIELAPETILAPSQADIQFDDRNGQRYWSFRPLVKANTNAFSNSASQQAAATNTTISHSAANLELSQPSSETMLPIDPYDTGNPTQMVSVPPLDESALPAVPPMVVPSLETAATEAPVVYDAVANNSIDSPRDEPLPELTADGIASPTTPTESVLQSQPEVAPEIVLSPSIGSVNIAAELTEPEVLESVATIENESIDIATAPPGVSPSLVPIVETETPQPTEQAPIEQSAIAALANSSSAPQTTSEEEISTPSWKTVQQPAAARTIVQTTMPAPLTFGQPLPQ